MAALGDGQGQVGSGGLRGLDVPEEFERLSQHPDEHRDEMSPSRAMSRDEDLEDLPDDPPREESPREDAEAFPPAIAPKGLRAPTLTPTL